MIVELSEEDVNFELSWISCQGDGVVYVFMCKYGNKNMFGLNLPMSRAGGLLCILAH